MESIFVESAGTGIIYNSDKPLYDYFMKNGKFLEFPGLKISKDLIENQSEYSLTYQKSLIKSLECSDKQINISFPIERVNELSIIYPGYILIEKARINNSSVSFHSACIEKDGKGILFLGKIGSGKTTTTINLCRNYGYNLISNDVTVVKIDDKKLEALDGTKFLFLRYESLKRNLPDLLPIFDDKEVDVNYRNGKKNIDNWQKKIRILPNEINISCSSQPVEIKKIFMLHIDDSQKKIYESNDNTLNTSLLLNEELSKVIRGINTTFRDNKNIASLYIPSIDTAKHYILRNNIIDCMLNKIGIEYISGNINDVSKCIDEKVKRIGR